MCRGDPAPKREEAKRFSHGSSSADETKRQDNRQPSAYSQDWPHRSNRVIPCCQALREGILRFNFLHD